MNENEIFAEQKPEENRKPMHTASLVLGILAIVLGLLIPLVGEILGVIAIVLAGGRRETHRTTAGMVCGIVGLVTSVANHVLGVLLMMGLI